MEQKQKLIILPGWNGSKQTWSGFVSLASSDFEVEVIELPCFGEESCPSSIWGVEEYSQFVKDKIISLKQEGQSTILLGHSFGGQVASYLLSHEPNIVDKLILSGAAVYRRPESIRNKIFKFIAKSGKIVFRLPGLNKLAVFMRKLLYKSAGTGDYNKTTGIKRDIFLKITKEDVSEFLPAIKIPTLVVWGDKDSFVPVKDATLIANNIVGSKLEVIKNGTHGLHLWKKEELLNIIKSFSKI
ncbi:MAG: alpha/beta hydrolase [Candidatus Magasanikbacteria bacterium]